MLIPLEEAEKIIENTEFKKANIEEVQILEAVGKVVGEDVISQKNVPETNLSAMDGFAFNLKDYEKYRRLKIVGKLYPSSKEIPELKEGEAYYVTTGGPIPKGANTVARIEASKIVGDYVEFSEQLYEGKDIKFLGEDIKQGEVIIEKGEILTPYHLGLLTIQGINTIKVLSIRSCIIASGDELKPYGNIPDSISPILLKIMEKFGKPTYLGVVRDVKEEIENKLREATNTCDYIILIGGSSKGDKDYSKKVIRELGKLLFEGVNVNVIKHGGVGVIDNKPIINLPGQVVSAVTVFHQHGLHILSRMINKEVRKYESYLLSEDVDVKHKMDSVYMFKTYGVYAKPLRWGTGLYSDLSKANGFSILKRGVSYKKGEYVNLQKFVF
jgi:molybdopterin molybdotransferase